MAKRPLRRNSSKARASQTARASRQRYHLRLYVTDLARPRVVALENLKQICEQHLKGRYTIKVIDLLEHPERARDDEIVMIPTLVREGSGFIKRMVGDLSNAEQVLEGLDLRPPVMQALA